MKKKKKIYFASDFHLGINTTQSSNEREKLIIEWLTIIKTDASEIYLVGDVFDFWFEYKSVVPKGYFRLFSTLNVLVQDGIKIHFIKGNHDLWQFEYLQKEVGLIVHDGPVIRKYDNHSFFIAHGDGLGPGDLRYKFIKKLLSNKLCQRLFACIHPTIGLALMKYMSQISRKGHDNIAFSDQANRRAIDYSEMMISSNQNHDFYIMGHWHHPIIHPLSNGISQYINLGDWMNYYTYGVWDGESFSLTKFISKNTNGSPS